MNPVDLRSDTVTTPTPEMRRAMGINLEPYLAQLGEDDRAALHRGIDVMRHLMSLQPPD